MSRGIIDRDLVQTFPDKDTELILYCGSYRSAVAAIPGLGPAAWLAVGPAGSDVSTDDGRAWSPAGGAGYDAVSIAPGGRTGFASGAGGRLARVTVAR